MRARTLVAVVAILVATTPGAAAAQATGPAGERRLVTELEVPGGVARLLRAAGVPGLTDPAVAIPAFIRAVHVLPPKPRTDLPALFDQAFGATAKAAAQTSSPDAAGDIVPLPLTLDWWCSVVLKQRRAPDTLAAAILGDRRAALIYVGLMSLDDQTLAHFLAQPEAIDTMNSRAAGAFAQWGRSIHIEGGRVLVPGGDRAAATWQEIVGERPSEPTAFVRALLSRDGGRAAYFYDALTHLDRERQAFALGVARGSGRVDRAKALYSTVASTGTFIVENDWPVVRHPFGPAAVLRQVKVDGEGRMTSPAGEAFWEAAIAEDSRGCTRASRGGGSIDAAQLVERTERQPLESRGHWVAAIAFAQRVFAGAGAADLPAACEVINAFPRSDGLLLALERIGFERPADYLSVLRFAERAWSGADRRAAVIRTAQVQGILQILERAVSTRSLSVERGRELALSLTTLPSADALPDGAAGLWLRKTLLAGSCPGASSADACVVHLVSGEGSPGGDARIVPWEDDRYRVNLGAATAVTLERVRSVQKATRMDEALDILEAATIAGRRQPSSADLERAATIVKALTPGLTLNGPTLFGHPVPPIRSTLDGALPGLAATRTDAQATAAATALVNAADFLLADALVSFAYAMAIGDPDDAVLMGGNPSRGHLFDGTLGPATPPWHLPEEVQAVDRSWLVEGSVLMLRTIYGKSWIRRLSIHDPGAAVRPDPQDVRVFGETVTAFNAFDLTDQGRDAIVAAIHRGRNRVAALMAAPTEFWKAAREAGLGEWRCRAALWTAARPPAARAAVLDPAAYFSLAELMWLGSPEASPPVIDAWGVATRAIDGGLSVRMPRTSTWEDYQGPRGVGQLATQMADVHLAVAEALTDLGLPAVLAPDVAAQAVWDVMAAARMAHRDDWYALVRAAQSIPRDRFLDYVSALTAIGPLVPVKQ